MKTHEIPLAPPDVTIQGVTLELERHSLTLKSTGTHVGLCSGAVEVWMNARSARTLLMRMRAGQFVELRAGGRALFEQVSGGLLLLRNIAAAHPEVQAMLCVSLDLPMRSDVGRLGQGYKSRDFEFVTESDNGLAHLVDSGAFDERLYHRIWGSSPVIVELEGPIPAEGDHDEPWPICLD